MRQTNKQNSRQGFFFHLFFTVKYRNLCARARLSVCVDVLLIPTTASLSQIQFENKKNVQPANYLDDRGAPCPRERRAQISLMQHNLAKLSSLRKDIKKQKMARKS